MRKLQFTDSPRNKTVTLTVVNDCPPSLHILFSSLISADLSLRTVHILSHQIYHNLGILICQPLDVIFNKNTVELI